MSWHWSLLGLVALVVAVAGCDGASAAREPAGKSGPPNDALAAAPTPGRPLPQPTANSKAIGIPTGAPKVDARGIMESTFDDLKFEMDKAAKFERSMLTPKVESLFGKRIRIRGYMFPTPQSRGIKQFVLVRDNMECCFGPGAALYDCVLVTMDEGNAVEYSIRPIAVEGQFRLDELKGPDGRALAIYQMKGETVK
jgi:hypothetical protein